MGAIRIKNIIPSSKHGIVIRKRTMKRNETSATVALQLIRGNKKITQRRAIRASWKTNSMETNSELSIHLHKLNDTFLGLKRSYIYDEISMDITVPQEGTIKKRKKIILKKK